MFRIAKATTSDPKVPFLGYTKNPGSSNSLTGFGENFGKALQVSRWFSAPFLPDCQDNLLQAYRATAEQGEGEGCDEERERKVGVLLFVT